MESNLRFQIIPLNDINKNIFRAFIIMFKTFLVTKNILSFQNIDKKKKNMTFFNIIYIQLQFNIMLKKTASFHLIIIFNLDYTF